MSSSAFDALTEDTQARLLAWPKRAQGLFQELLEDAPSDLQRELLQRAVGAGHTPAEVHAFADELRGLSDEQAFEACTVSQHTAGYTVDQLLHAEGDPLYAFELRGGRLSPAEEAHLPDGAGPLASAGSGPQAFGALESDPAPRLQAKLERRFQGESPRDAPRPKDLRVIGESVEHTPRPAATTAGAPAKAAPGALLEDLLNEATRALGVSFREHDVDLTGGLNLESALQQAFGPVMRGVPIPVALGPEPGQHRRLVLLLQAQVSGKTRAWQLYDPQSQELAWANEGDLLARAELPLSNKQHRRVTRIALPVQRAHDL